MDQYIGKMLDSRYEILEVIGTGGMAVVYKARCHRLNRLVAIKILRDDLAQDAEFRRRFHDESQAVAMLSHPNIMAVYDVSRSSELEYIVMELLDGITLKQYMQKKGSPLNWREALHFISQIMKALSHAHSRGIIHRDIKPQNIMVLRDGSVKVADFGIARLASSAQNTLTQEALGSVHYISPEQARGSRIDARSDIYSAGVVLYEMLTGRLPFEGDSPVSVAIQHINSIPLAPRELNPDIPEALEAITIKAMAPAVDQRYVSSDAMLSDLEEFRKNPNINFDYAPQDFIPPDLNDEPTQVIDTGRHRTHSPAGERRREEAEDYEPPRRKRKKRGGGMSVPLAAAVILIFLVSIGAFLWITFFSSLISRPVERQVPNLAGLTLEEARADDRVSGIFELKAGESVESDLPAGQIIAQDPAAETTIQADGVTIISVTLSAGKENSLTMPELENQEFNQVLATLRNMGLKDPVPTYEPSDTITKGYVISCVPLPGAPVTPDTDIQLVVSLGPKKEEITLISFVGMPLDEAKSSLELFELKMGKEIPVPSDEYPAGTVVDQSIPVGTAVATGTAINFKVSTGPAESAPPAETETPQPPPDVTAPPTSEEPTTPVTPDPNATVNTKNIRIILPDKEYEHINVQIRVGDEEKPQYNVNIPKTMGSIINPAIRGSGVQQVEIKVEGQPVEYRTVDFTAG